MNSEYSYPFEHPAAEKIRRLFLELPSLPYERLSDPQKALWDVRWFEIEVMNGGFDQYFYNSAGSHWAQCLNALKLIGAEQSYRLLKRMCDLFPEGRPSDDRTIRREQLRTLVGNNTLDDVFPSDQNLEPDLYQRLLDYYLSVEAE